jgi:hypothetical protein
MNQVVAHYQNGLVLKGQTNDFLPTKALFHLIPSDVPAGEKPWEIQVGELKAIFFVRDLEGKPDYQEAREPDPDTPMQGRKIRVTFKDGEVMVGTTQGYQPGRPGFFIVPVDQKSNNERCFIVAAAAQEVRLL